MYYYENELSLFAIEDDVYIISDGLLHHHHVGSSECKSPKLPDKLYEKIEVMYCLERNEETNKV